MHRWSVQELWEFGFKTCFIGGCLVDSKRRIYIFLHLFSAVSRSVTSWLGNWGYYLCNCSAHWICNIVKVDPLVLFPWRTLGLDRTPLRQLLKLGPGVCFFVMYISWSGKGQAVFTWHFAQLMHIKKGSNPFMCALCDVWISYLIDTLLCKYWVRWPDTQVLLHMEVFRWCYNVRKLISHAIGNKFQLEIWSDLNLEAACSPWWCGLIFTKITSKTLHLSLACYQGHMSWLWTLTVFKAVRIMKPIW